MIRKYEGIETGDWFRKYCTISKDLKAKPIAIDIYYDDWKVSKCCV